MMQMLMRICIVMLMLTVITVNARVDKTRFYTNFEDTHLVDQNGKDFSISTLDDHLVIVNFIFTQCSNVCPIQVKSLKQVKASLPPDVGAKVKFVSVSLDPMHDKPAVLKAFARRMHADIDGWSFLTGSADDIQKIIDRLSLFGGPEKLKTAKQPNDHLSIIWLIDKRGRLMQRYAGNPVNVQRIASEIQQLNLLK